MSWIAANIGLILTVSGAATCSMIAQAVAPRFAVRLLFGEEIATPSGLLVARSWGAMIFCSGLMLIYAASHPDVRWPIMLYAIFGKLSFVVPVFMSYRRSPAMLAAIGDLVIVVLFAWYLAA